MKKQTSRILATTSVGLLLTAVALARAPQSADPVRVELTPATDCAAVTDEAQEGAPSKPAAPLMASDPLCLRCHWCPV